MEDNYTGFAGFYDEFMEDIPYDKWAEFIIGQLKSHGISDGIVCELGCGTCEMTMRLSDAGYDMIGIDRSEDMLAVAYDKFAENDISNIMLLNQDMREFELYGTVNAFICVCDSINYITDSEDLKKVFRLVNNYLEKDGLFIFDIKTRHFYEEDYGDGEFYDEAEDASLKWHNHYDSKKQLNFYDLTVSYNDGSGEDFIKESHVQRAYDISEIEEAIRSSGMKLLNVTDFETKKEPDENSRRVFFTASEGFQKGKKYIGG